MYRDTLDRRKVKTLERWRERVETDFTDIETVEFRTLITDTGTLGRDTIRYTEGRSELSLSRDEFTTKRTGRRSFLLVQEDVRGIERRKKKYPKLQ